MSSAIAAFKLTLKVKLRAMEDLLNLMILCSRAKLWIFITKNLSITGQFKSIAGEEV